MEPAFFSAASLFGNEVEEREAASEYEERDHQFPGVVLRVREFAFHQVNANLLWPGCSLFAQWLFDHKHLLQGRCILEIGSGTGALAIFLKKVFGAEITTSDYDDEEIETNIAYNCQINDLQVLPHLRHTWGERFPKSFPHWDLVIASDILLYVNQYESLIKTIKFLLQEFVPFDTNVSQKAPRDNYVTDIRTDYKRDANSSSNIHFENAPDVLPQPCFLMSWRRRIPKEHERLFFRGCQEVGLSHMEFGSRVYCIY